VSACPATVERHRAQLCERGTAGLLLAVPIVRLAYSQFVSAVGHETGRTYWLDLFTSKSWEEFQKAGAKTSGFSAGRWSYVRKMRLGDYLLCYITGISRWVGVLEVTGEPFQDETPIWTDATYPSRVRVRVIHALTPETGVPVLELRDELTVFRNLSNPNFWSGAFRGSPAKWTPGDGLVVVRAIAEAVDNPVVRPVDKARLAHRPKALRTPIGDVTLPDTVEAPSHRQIEGTTEATDVDATAHTEIQALLLRLGASMGLDVWVARNDRSRMWRGRTLSDQFKIRADLPHNFDTATSRVIELIDVLWLEGNAFRAAFEIESTTSIYSGLLRMSDLVSMQPNLQIPLFLVAPDERRSKVIAEVNRPTFASLNQPLVEVCRFLSFSALRGHIEQAGPLLKYLKPDVLQEISEACDAEEA
jgi:EVE domain